ncbi:unnamed protein product [Macrosiphum euphorbiae]|uniref:Secreted protein n=1 Tax=Macrosiphum euphorbiae TaxID=13131 RepID=A0AAV0WVE0_9HEMI|nr:unnamed protein product [Macrosiphum euphorbiae]
MLPLVPHEPARYCLLIYSPLSSLPGKFDIISTSGSTCGPTRSWRNSSSSVSKLMKSATIGPWLRSAMVLTVLVRAGEGTCGRLEVCRGSVCLAGGCTTNPRYSAICMSEWFISSSRFTAHIANDRPSYGWVGSVCCEPPVGVSAAGSVTVSVCLLL